MPATEHAFAEVPPERRYLDTDVLIAALVESVQHLAIDHIVRYNLASQDAIHLASARREEVTHFASLDEQFRRVYGLHLWNDLIHTSA